MASGESQSRPSFTPWRKWSIGFNVALIILVVFSVVVMVNYLSRDYFTRFHLSTTSQHALSPRTLELLHSITNKVRVVVYYDKNEPFYSTVVSLLNEYHDANKRISIEIVDYIRDAGAAQQIKAQYNLNTPTATNLVIFECESRKKVLDGSALTHYILEQVPNEKEREFRHKPTQFEGERMFTDALYNVITPTVLKAYFIQGHREHPVDESELGFAKFVNIAMQNTIEPKPLSLLGTNGVPMDCNLLVIAGPRDAFADFELEKIDQYLSQGGRLLALFNAGSISRETGGEITGLDKILAKWGIELGTNIIHDPDQASASGRGQDIVVNDFNPKHSLVNPLLDSSIHMIRPRAVQKLKSLPQTADAPKVEELAFSGPNATSGASPPQRYSLLAAVEKGAIKGVITERGSTRILVAGDSLFLTNTQIRSAANRDFAEYALNWLLERTQLLGGVGPRSIVEYRIVMSQTQLQRVEWILLGAIPGGVLLLGGLVWLRRRR
jgi:hypothetical protein